MNLQTWAEWVAQIGHTTGGGTVELVAGPVDGMTIRVQWRNGDKLMGYDHPLSMIEMRGMYDAVQPRVLSQITDAVRKMMTAA